MASQTLSSKDLELFHYGVKGMKWGVRRKSGSGGTSSEKSERKAKIREEQKKIYAKDRQSYSLKTGKGAATSTALLGSTVAASILGGPWAGLQAVNTVGGYTLSRSAGYGKGKSAAIGLIGGYPGGMIATSVSARKRADQDS